MEEATRSGGCWRGRGRRVGRLGRTRDEGGADFVCLFLCFFVCVNVIDGVFVWVACSSPGLQVCLPQRRRGPVWVAGRCMAGSGRAAVEIKRRDAADPRAPCGLSSLGGVKWLQCGPYPSSTALRGGADCATASSAGPPHLQPVAYASNV